MMVNNNNKGIKQASDICSKIETSYRKLQNLLTMNEKVLIKINQRII